MPILLKNYVIVPIKWPNPKFLSMINPSTWWNSAKCVASND